MYPLFVGWPSTVTPERSVKLRHVVVIQGLTTCQRICLFKSLNRPKKYHFTWDYTHTHDTYNYSVDDI